VKTTAMPRFRFLALMLLAGGLPLAGAFAASGMVTEVFTIGYRPVDEMIQILRPMIPGPGSVSGAYGKIVVRTTPANMREIKEILATLNRAPSNLLISVRHSMNEEVRRDLYEAFGEVSGSNVGLSTGRGSGSGRGLVIRHQDGDQEAGVRLDKTQAVASDHGTQRVRVLEGKEAFIRSGQSVPLTGERVVVSSTGVTTVQTSTGFRNVDSGFTVRARLNDNDRVTVEIFLRHNRLDSGSGAIDSREASTVVTSPLGRWMEIGRIGAASSGNTRAIGTSSSTTTSSGTATYLKVERLDR
jgi:type II secretory pathway component GspD/PulD (secretin)